MQYNELIQSYKDTQMSYFTNWLPAETKRRIAFANSIYFSIHPDYVIKLQTDTSSGFEHIPQCVDVDTANFSSNPYFAESWILKLDYILRTADLYSEQVEWRYFCPVCKNCILAHYYPVVEYESSCMCGPDALEP